MAVSLVAPYAAMMKLVGGILLMNATMVGWQYSAGMAVIKASSNP
jgi:hypothetical protein